MSRTTSPVSTASCALSETDASEDAAGFPVGGMGRAASSEGLEVDWATVDPAAVASLEMALAMGPNFDGPLMEAARRAEAEAAAAAEARAAVAAKQEADAARLAAELAELAAMADGSDSEADADTAENADDAEAADDTPAIAADDDGGEDEDEEGMGCAMGTAEASALGEEDEDWALERIVRRRKARGPAGSFDADVDPEDTRWEYLCAWRGHAEATWERRAWLRDYGLGEAVTAFDAATAPAKPTSTRTHRPKKPARNARSRTADPHARETTTQEIHRRLTEQRAARAAYARYYQAVETFGRFVDRAPWANLIQRWAGRAGPELFPPPRPQLAIALDGAPSKVLRDRRVQSMLDYLSEPCPEVRLSPDCEAAGRFYEAILRDSAWNSHNAGVSSITKLKPASLAPFLKTAREHPKLRVEVVFHGTRKAAVGPIRSVGLVVPRPDINGVRVVNGSAYGVGIYTATCLATPLSYARSGGVFVCLGLVGDETKCKSTGSFRIFFDEAYVSPVLYVQYSSTRPLEIEGNTLVDFRAPGLF